MIYTAFSASQAVSSKFQGQIYHKIAQDTFKSTKAASSCIKENLSFADGLVRDVTLKACGSPLILRSTALNSITLCIAAAYTAPEDTLTLICPISLPLMAPNTPGLDHEDKIFKFLGVRTWVG